jgi:uncharacterized protein
MITTFAIFIIAYLFIGLHRIGHGHIDRPTGALTAILAISINTLVLPLEVTLAHGAESVSSEQQKRQMMITVTPANPAAQPKTYRVVLICDTEDTRSNGLQGFRKLKKDEAALFIFDEPEIVSFWMASVKYPIDIIFVGSDKKVTRVYRNRKPGSKDLYPSGKPATWVIETASGSNIKAGDRVRIE